MDFQGERENKQSNISKQTPNMTETHSNGELDTILNDQNSDPTAWGSGFVFNNEGFKDTNQHHGHDGSSLSQFGVPADNGRMAQFT